MNFVRWLKNYEYDVGTVGKLARAMIEEQAIVDESQARGLPFVIDAATNAVYRSWRSSYNWIKKHLIRLNKDELLYALDNVWSLYTEERRIKT